MTHPTDPKAQEMAEKHVQQVFDDYNGEWNQLSGADLRGAYLAGHRSRDAEIEALVEVVKTLRHELKMLHAGVLNMQIENKRFREALMHYECAHYDHQGNACYRDKTATEALNPPAAKGERNGEKA